MIFFFESFFAAPLVGFEHPLQWQTTVSIFFVQTLLFRIVGGEEGGGEGREGG